VRIRKRSAQKKCAIKIKVTVREIYFAKHRNLKVYTKFKGDSQFLHIRIPDQTYPKFMCLTTVIWRDCPFKLGTKWGKSLVTKMYHAVRNIFMVTLG
jgi:hypothetical protein